MITLSERRRFNKSKEIRDRPLWGPWTDIDHGTCQSCLGERRLYRPSIRPDLALCSNCAVAKHHSSLAIFEDAENESDSDLGRASDRLGRVNDMMDGL